MGSLIGDDLAGRSALISWRRRKEARFLGVDHRLYDQSELSCSFFRSLATSASSDPFSYIQSSKATRVDSKIPIMVGPPQLL